MTHFQELKDLFASIYLVKDPYVLKMLVAGVLSQRTPADPVWFVIVAPSGSGKTEYINAVSTCQGIKALSTLTAKTFISGSKVGGKDNSLLTSMENGIITFKDMTSLLSERHEDRSIIMGQLREIYDGKYSKTFGTGETINWEGKMTVIAGATYAIHSMKQAYSAMGERFLFYNMIQPERIDAARKAMENQEEGSMAKHRAMLAEATRKYIDETVKMPPKFPKITKELRDELLILAELATRARSDVERNWRSPQQEITEVHPPEMPTRMAGQLQALARTLMVINWNETGKQDLLEDDRAILDKLALDSINRSRRIAMQELAKYDVIQTAGLAVKLGLPTNSVRRWLEDLTALEVAQREKGTGNQGDRWCIAPKYKDVILTFENITAQTGELTEQASIEGGGDHISVDDRLALEEAERVKEETQMTLLESIPAFE